MPYPTLTFPSFCTEIAAPFASIDSHTTELIRTPGRLTNGAITFVTTDKNPAVVFPTQAPPHYSFTSADGQQPDDAVHSSVTVINVGDSPGNPPQQISNAPTSTPAQTFSITASSDQVIIDGSTFSNLGPSETRTVSANDGLFTIKPTAVIGDGQTIFKPDAKTTKFLVVDPTSTQMDGVSVTVSGASATIDGTSFEIPAKGTQVTAGGRAVSIGPDAVVIGGSTLGFDAAPAGPTNHIVVGGDLLTVIGPSIAVIHSTTFTYGVGIPRTKETIDGDVVTIGPSGVTVDGTTMGGASAKATDFTFHVVGGLTLTERGASILIVDRSTFTVGPRAAHITTVIDGQTLTLGPKGVQVASLTFTYPFGPVVTASLVPTGAYGQSSPTETDSTEESAALMVQPVSGFFILIACIAIGVLNLL